MIWQSSLARELCTVWQLGCKWTVRLRGVDPRQVAARSGRLWQWAARCVADSSQIAWRSQVRGGETLAGSTAGPCPFTRWRDVGVKGRYSLLDCHWQITLCSNEVGSPFLMYGDRLTLPDAQSCLVLDVSPGWSLLMCLLGVGVEWSPVENVAFFIQTSRCSTCPAIG